MTEPIDFASPDQWPSAVEHYLLGKQEARLGVVAKEAIGIDRMPNADWRRLTVVMLRLGWRCHNGADGALVWSPDERAAATARGHILLRAYLPLPQL